MKLWEGNVFTGVCLSIHGGSSCDHYPWCTGPHCTGPPTASPSRHRIWGPSLPLPLALAQPCPLLVTSGGYHWRPVQTCSLGIIVQSLPHWYWHLVATKAHMVGKQTVSILLECFMVELIEFFFSLQSMYSERLIKTVIIHWISENSWLLWVPQLEVGLKNDSSGLFTCMILIRMDTYLKMSVQKLLR